MDNFEQVFADVRAEVISAVRSNTPMHSLHEAKGVIDEEVFEFHLEAYKNPRKHPDRMALARKELIQVAAMAIRAINDVCDSGTPK